MRILQVNNFHYPRGGSDQYFLNVTKLLREEGHTVRTFSTADGRNVFEDWMVTEPVSKTDTQRFGSVRNVMGFMFSLEARRRMQRAIRVFKPDVAHLHIYYGQLTASILRPLLDAGVPVIQTLHEYKLVCATHGLYADGQFCDVCQGRHHWPSWLLVDWRSARPDNRTFLRHRRDQSEDVLNWI